MKSDKTHSAVQSQAVEAWLDVGGTFTDCFVQAGGSDRLGTSQLRRGKVLSSGRVPVSLRLLDQPSNADTNSTRLYRCDELATDAIDFWRGAHLIVLDSLGAESARHLIVNSSPAANDVPATVTLEQGIEPKWLNSDSRFEIDAGLEAPVLCVRRLLRVPLTEHLPDLRVRLGTTKGTNALLTRTGATTALAITLPFEDLLTIGDQTRPDLFDLAATKPKPLAALTVGIAERLDADGQVVVALNERQATDALQRAYDAGCRSLAICLMHSYVCDAHERRVEALARNVGFTDISRSSHVAPLIEIVARAQTTVVDAYLSPIIRGYLNQLAEQFQGRVHSNDAAATGGGAQPKLEMKVMTSAGGLVDWKHYSGKDSILSGPAGGVAALSALHAALTSAQNKALDATPLIGLDMGGTSTDVCRVSGQHDLQYESTKAGVRILTPTLPIETVAAGGGSICWFDGVSLRVGPESAGSSPGPACYGRGGPLTVTDLNVYLERIPIEQFPFPLDQQAIVARLEALSEATELAGTRLNALQLASGFRRIANEQMAEAVRSVSIAQGADPRGHILVGFGGAAGQHVCEIAASLGIDKILDLADGGLLSALGMGLAGERNDAALPVYTQLKSLDFSTLVAQAEQLAQQIKLNGNALSQVYLEMRYAGTDTSIAVAQEEDMDGELLATKFHAAHRQRFGYAQAERAIEVVSVRAQSATEGSHHLSQPRRVTEPEQVANLEAIESGDSGNVPRVAREQLVPGQEIQGPAIVLNAGSTLFIESSWQATVLSDGTLSIESQASGATLTDAQAADPTAAFDPVFRDCLAARLAAIATQMGLVLQQTAISVNVRQRRDFSCAVFDARGQLLASAPHVPVHLGAMGETVRAVMRVHLNMQPGDMFVTNDPYQGGSHLPDITLVTPVFAQPGSAPVMFVASRAHHADVGGISPGSMSVKARTLAEEGTLIPITRLNDGGDSNTSPFAAMKTMLEQATYPPRNITENLADLAAQHAANQRGCRLLQEYAAQESWQKLTAYSEHLLAASDTRVRQFVQSSSLRDCSFVDHLDDGTPIAVSVRVQPDGSLRISFEGTGPVSQFNFNANPSIVAAAVMYVLRCLIADDLPLNEGVLRSVSIEVPPGLLNPSAVLAAAPERGVDLPAVAAGNVETSQRVVDVLLGAFGAAAASQGTMNNLLFGNEEFGFYETICGGAGGTPIAKGESGVHTHMTNTRLTDPEILESRYPVRLVEFRLRTGSGGAGQHPGGNGVIRHLQFLAPVTVSLLTSRRGEFLPFGLSGGLPGAVGENWLIDRDGGQQKLPNCCEFTVAVGEQLRLLTPSGGGFGTVPANEAESD